LIPVGPLSEINTKGKIEAIRNGDLLTIKGIRKVGDKTPTVVMGNTREEIGSQNPDLRTDETPIPAVIHVGYNQLDNAKTFEKIFTDRVLLAPVIDKKGHGARAGIERNVTSLVHGSAAASEVTAKKRHLMRRRKHGPGSEVGVRNERTRGIGKGILVKTHRMLIRSHEDKGNQPSANDDTSNRAEFGSNNVGDDGNDKYESVVKLTRSLNRHNNDTLAK